MKIVMLDSDFIYFVEKEKIMGLWHGLKMDWGIPLLLIVLVVLTWYTLSKTTPKNEQRISSLSKGVTTVLVLLPIWLISLTYLDGAFTLFIMLIFDSIAMIVSIGTYVRKLKTGSSKIKMR